MLEEQDLPVLIEDCTAAQKRRISQIYNRVMRGDIRTAGRFAHIAATRMANARVIVMYMQVINSADRAAYNAAVNDFHGDLRPHMNALAGLDVKLLRAQTVHERLNRTLVNAVRNFNLYMLAGIKAEGDMRARGEQADIERLQFFAPRLQSLNQYASQMNDFLVAGKPIGESIRSMREGVGLMLDVLDRQLRRDDAPQP